MTGGDDFGLRIEDTVAEAAGAAIATFLLGFAPASPLRFLFFALGSAIFASLSGTWYGKLTAVAEICRCSGIDLL